MFNSNIKLLKNVFQLDTKKSAKKRMLGECNIHPLPLRGSKYCQKISHLGTVQGNSANYKKFGILTLC